MTTQLDAPVLDLARVEEFAYVVAAHAAQAYNGVLVYLGDRLGLWKALAAVDSATSEELAERSGLAERYVREWLSAQAAARYVTYDAGTFEVVTAVYQSADRLAHAYASGEGVGWHEHDSRLFGGVDRFFRTQYRNSLISEWIPAIDGLTERLEQGIHVIDVGCGLGSATILMAEAFPNSRFVGVDYHEESIRRATAAAEAAGVSDRVHFHVGDASSYAGTYDLVCFFDAVHDMGDPVGALAQARASLRDGGQVFAVEPFAEDRLEDSLAAPAALAYFVASSCLCVPNSISQGGAALGAQAGPGQVTAAFLDAGFGSAAVAAQTPYNLLIEAHA